MKKERLELLDEKFRASDLEWRIQQFGISNGKPWAKVLCYVTSRAIQNRLDEVCGKADWSTEIKTVDGSYICRLGINIDGQWVYKEDGAEETKVEAVKGGISGSVKRAGVQWGIGRYLYELGESWAIFTNDRKDAQYSYYHKETKTTYFWNPPFLPDWALPKSEKEKLANVQKPVKDETKADSVIALENIINNYREQLQGEPLQLACECLDNGGDCDAMVTRCKTYLSKKGIKVA